ncbi:MAG: LuxR C-terminal-related transcriptional regulator [Candidatus Thiodiazotropha sp. (ex Ustalcina ferruginea)]|nr:LuxR C-terminal-related transcriptional regulator [Candidatus Thiodiazotropha sp. (ex Ustalcina ferruginea)]
MAYTVSSLSDQRTVPVSNSMGFHSSDREFSINSTGDASILDSIGSLFETVATDAFYPCLVDVLRKVAYFDDLAIIIFRSTKVPMFPYLELAVSTPDANTAYLQGLYTQSPWYDYCQKGGGGFKTLREVAPDGFFESSYYYKCMMPAHLKDEVAFAIQGESGAGYVICMGRTRVLPPFSKDETRQLEALTSTIRQAILSHNRLCKVAAGVTDSDGADSTSAIATKLKNIASNMLTERELEILGYLIRGYSSKGCARELDISPATERVHRKNIYQKLGVNSQSGLLARVFDTLFT